jgi:hypothetical protein
MKFNQLLERLKTLQSTFAEFRQRNNNQILIWVTVIASTAALLMWVIGVFLWKFRLSSPSVTQVVAMLPTPFAATFYASAILVLATSFVVAVSDLYSEKKKRIPEKDLIHGRWATFTSEISAIATITALLIALSTLNTLIATFNFTEVIATSRNELRPHLSKVSNDQCVSAQSQTSRLCAVIREYFEMPPKAVAENIANTRKIFSSDALREIKIFYKPLKLSDSMYEATYDAQKLLEQLVIIETKHLELTGVVKDVSTVSSLSFYSMFFLVILVVLANSVKVGRAYRGLMPRKNTLVLVTDLFF